MRVLFLSIIFFIIGNLSFAQKEINLYIDKEYNILSLNHYAPYSSDFLSSFQMGNFFIKNIKNDNIIDENNGKINIIYLKNPYVSNRETSSTIVGRISTKTEWISSDGGMYLWTLRYIDNSAIKTDYILSYLDLGYSSSIQRVVVDNNILTTNSLSNENEYFNLSYFGDIDIIFNEDIKVIKIGAFNFIKIKPYQYNDFSKQITTESGVIIGKVKSSFEWISTSNGVYFVKVTPSFYEDEGKYLFFMKNGAISSINRVVVENRFSDDIDFFTSKTLYNFFN